MEFEVLGGPDDGPTLDLDHRRFRYAGKFVMSNTGKAVIRESGAVIAAAAFNRDRTDGDVAWIRYITVRDDRRGAGIGARLAAAVTEHLLGKVEQVRIGVNNPFSYEALYKAGFGYTGERTGLAELVLARPGDRSPESYRAGLAAFRERDDLAPEEEAFVDERARADPPEPIAG